MQVTAFEFRKLIDEKGKLAACQQLFPSCVSEQQADKIIESYVLRFLQADNKLGAAIVLWGDTIFNPRPKGVRRVWRALERKRKLLIQGAGSYGKSYSVAAWLLLDWWTDPNFTSIKVISTTQKHAKSSTFSTMVRLFRDAIIQMPGEITGEYIGLDAKDKKSGIALIAIPQGESGKGRLQGFHPDPRPKPHPRFGISSRIRIFLDECEEIPFGVWEGVDNFLLSISGNHTLKVIGAYNPKDISTKTASNAEPVDGWEAFDVETGVGGYNEWQSKEGWHVLRLDGKHIENVKERRLIYPGFMTYEGYKELESKNGGNSPELYTFGRGAYPPIGVNNVIIAPDHIKRSRGEFIFIGHPINVGGVDTAVDGRDNCIFTRGRAGMAIGFIPPRQKMVKFKEPRLVLTADQQFELKKGDTKIVGDDIIANAVALGISPEYLGIDSTGNGAAVWAYICAQWGKIHGICFSDEATEIKILEQDIRTPLELYDGLVTEVWYALRYWMEFGYMALNPGLRGDPLEAEMLGRRYVLSKGKLVKVEKKDDYKKRLGRSPDYADSLTIFLHVARKQQAIMGSMTGVTEKRDEESNGQYYDGDELSAVEWLPDESV